MLNYTQLAELDRQYRDRGLQILLYPCNQWGQEPGSHEEILAFAQSFGTTFTVFEKGDVNGSRTQPVFKYLKSKLRGTLVSTIKWNFTKFLIDRRGQPVKRLGGFTPPIHMVDDIVSTDIHGVLVPMETFRGRVCLVVNVNYTQLVELDRKYRARGLEILGFPCNQFGGQEPGTPEEILAFVATFGVKFRLFEKADVNGEHTQEVYRFLKSRLEGDITWNFAKFLVDRHGTPVKRYEPKIAPFEIEADIEAALAEA
ncbi:glutathione peroxidase [Achlya hypogyna]|uniref:Glutathione peroxidase n=1 Tax=Achlya hypogyna TaxID=1202772 RepID=A0A1V9ZF66_ACHHY|nr:glutathione peroxidase [Achlya hypogyna]